MRRETRELLSPMPSRLRIEWPPRLAIVSLFAAVLGLTSEAWAQVKPDDVIEEVEAALEPVDQVIGEARTVLGQCPGNGSDDVMTTVGPLCVDVYEASLWSSRRGGTPVAASTCNPNGNDCTSIFARSLAGVTPSFDITWFQAQQACANSGKRLLTNAEWQMAAAGTPDYSTNSTDCNTLSGSVANTGAFATCFSNHGVHDMVGNLYEWVADWVPRSTGCGSWDFSDDEQCLSGAATSGEPGALIRGGWFSSASNAGVFAVFGAVQPSGAGYNLGFRCAR